MVQIDDKTKCIFLTRGDCATITVTLSSGSFQSGDEVKLNARLSNTSTPSISLTGTISGTTCTLTFINSTTKDLPYGVYLYDIQLKRGDVVQTIVAAELPDGTRRTLTLGLEVGS